MTVNTQTNNNDKEVRTKRIEEVRIEMVRVNMQVFFKDGPDHMPSEVDSDIRYINCRDKSVVQKPAYNLVLEYKVGSLYMQQDVTYMAINFVNHCRYGLTNEKPIKFLPYTLAKKLIALKNEGKLDVIYDVEEDELKFILSEEKD